MSAFPARGSLAAGLTVPPPPAASDILPITLAVSVVLHAIVLLITFAPPVFDGLKFVPHLDVVLVNSKTSSKPVKADALSQAHLDGGGNTEADRRAKANLPKLNNVEPAPNVQLASRQVQRLEEEAQRLLQLSQGANATADLTRPVPELPRETRVEDPAAEQQRLRIAQLEAQIAKEWDEYQKLPRRKFIGARTEGVVYAAYVDQWRQRIEKFGTRHFPEEARRRKLFGSLVMTVHIKADGSVEKVEIDRSSGIRLLDSAARRAVDLAGPFPPFPAAVRKDWDILSISRTFSYTRSDLELLDSP
ncbi:MAG: TonB family protein [Prolixibacteraceae bacterium]|nr:TonB family protein [Burkholderiales bacterium]